MDIDGSSEVSFNYVLIMIQHKNVNKLLIFNGTIIENAKQRNDEIFSIPLNQQSDQCDCKILTLGR